MSNLNTAWKYLIFLGIGFLVAVIGWEIYQVSTGGRTDFNVIVVDMPKTILFPKNLEDHLNNDQLNIVEIEETTVPTPTPQTTTP